MGLWNLLTKPINLGATVFRWSEPALYPLRLRGDLWLRAIIVLGVWAGATGIMLALFAINVAPPRLTIALGVGFALGGAPAAMLTMMLRNHTGGNVMIRQHEIHRNRRYASMSVFFFSWSEYSDWPYDAIRKCVIVPGNRINKPFSVILLSVGSETVMLGIPAKIDLKKLAGFLSGKGVTVTPGQSVPARFRKPLNLFVGLSIPAVALLICLAGTTFYVARVGLPGGDDRIAQGPGLAKLTAPPSPLTNPPLGGPGGPASRGGGDPTPETSSPQINNPAFPASEARGPGFGGRRFGSSGGPSETVAPLTGNRMPMVGGSGGSPFETIDERGRPVIGVRSRMGTWDGAPHVASLAPLFAAASPGRAESVQLARNGYALGAIDVSGTDFVDAVRPVFMKITSDGVDPADSYDGEWIGTPADGAVTRLSGEGAAVIGFHGRGAAVLDAVGLVCR